MIRYCLGVVFDDQHPPLHIHVTLIIHVTPFHAHPAVARDSTDMGRVIENADLRRAAAATA